MVKMVKSRIIRAAEEERLYSASLKRAAYKCYEVADALSYTDDTAMILSSRVIRKEGEEIRQLSEKLRQYSEGLRQIEREYELTERRICSFNASYIPMGSICYLVLTPEVVSRIRQEIIMIGKIRL